MQKSFKISFCGDFTVFDELITHCLNGAKEHLIIALNADLAMGKTTLANAFVRALCDEFATSPTFVKMNEYLFTPNARLAALAKGFSTLYHYDFYSQNDEQKRILAANLQLDGLHLCEWLDEKILAKTLEYGACALAVDIACSEDENSRNYLVRRLG